MLIYGALRQIINTMTARPTDKNTSGVFKVHPKHTSNKKRLIGRTALKNQIAAITVYLIQNDKCID